MEAKLCSGGGACGAVNGFELDHSRRRVREGALGAALHDREPDSELEQRSDAS